MNAPDTESASSPDWMDLLTRIALIVALVLVAVRMTTLEVIREAFDFAPQSVSVTGPGPTTTLVLDLLCWLPTLLILVRRAIDRRYTLRLHVSHLLMVLLAAWVAISCWWASDKFQAVISASTWCAAMSLGWAMSQLVRSWARFRLVSGIGIGLCLIFVIQAAIYTQLEWPETVKEWDRSKAEVMANRGWTADDFGFKQFDAKVRRGEMVGFFRSPNTYAAATALAMFVAAGIALQRWRDKDDIWFPIVIAVPVLASIFVLIKTGSRTAMAGVVICAVLFATSWWFRDLLAKRSRTFFAIALAAAILTAIAIVGIGLSTGGLVHDSLTFRWHYWVGSWELAKHHPLLGVGWSNFGTAYLPFRLPIASEEIKDPHNLFVKFATETGVVGLLLVMAWIARSAWEVSRPTLPRQSTAAAGSAIPILIAVPMAFLILRAIVNLPLSLINTELLKVVLFTFSIGFGLVMSNVRSATDLTSDDRPAPLILYGTLIGLAGFLLHAMVDFAMFETGPLLLMMLILGGTLGVRHAGAAGRKQRTPLALTALGVVFAGLMAYAALVVLPISTAEAASNRSRDLIAQQRYAAAAAELREAFVASPVGNSDYATRGARAMMQAQQADPMDIAAVLSQAISCDPANPMVWLERARFRRSLGQHELAKPDSVVDDYRQGLSRNPADVQTRIELADYLMSVSRLEEAKEQYRIALDFNDKLHPDEPKRLSPEKLASIKSRL